MALANLGSCSEQGNRVIPGGNIRSITVAYKQLDMS